MKKNLTVRIDSEVLREAKLKARAEKTSLSAIVEKHLREFVKEGAADADFFRKWTGFSLPKRDPSDPRLEHILDKLDRERNQG